MIDHINTAAKLLREAGQKGVPCNPVRSLIGEANIKDAYAIQKINTALHIADGYKVVGSKIGSTSIAVQKQFGILEPDFGVLFDEGNIENGGNISIKEIMQPKVEGEIAFILGKDLTAEQLTIEEIVTTISHAVVSIELLGSRIKDWDISLADTIADNASASHFVLGSKKVSLSDFDLINCKMIMQRNGKIVSQGQGSDSLGSPLYSMLWLAKTLTSLGNPMRAGDIILTGALGPIVDAKVGDNFRVTISGLGEVSVNFTP